MIERLTIVGIGLLGGSVAKAAREGALAREIVGVGRDARRLQPAVADGTLDRATTDLRDGVAGADLLVLAGPVLVNEVLLERVWPLAAPDAVITDVGSTKARLVERAARLHAVRPLGFVGSHPMAGSEQSGYAVARGDLFRGACVIVTPTDTTAPHVLKRVTSFWESVGGRVATLAPEAHDRVVAAISHLPHLVADALVDTVVRFAPGALEFAARGFRDATRIAASDPVMWQEIFRDNRPALLEGLATFRTALDDLEALVRANDAAALEAELTRIKTWRERVR